MDNQLSKHELMNRGEEAGRLLQDPVFVSAFDEIRERFIREWEKADSVPDREMCWAKVTGLGEVRRQLRRVISQGEHASRQPDER